VNGREYQKTRRPRQAKVRGQAHGAAGILLWGFCDWVVRRLTAVVKCEQPQVDTRILGKSS
jgi:hypothetical protein